ncbi:CIR protein [Plasmodium chabaudi adami]|uniref:CIR protein n=1 Tax=Plasmodium chabaudi adami TaxID=5826 RepID=A0A1D3LAF8_PLACE|nr:CIR protein [Plasmodium chabaudi adami]
MANEACKILREVDAYFKDEIVDESKFNNSGLFTYKCPYDKQNRKFRPCENNNERVNTLGVYLYEKLARIANKLNGEGDNANRHIEIFMMWLGDKSYKIDKNKTATLEDSYKDNLEKYTGNFKYWNVIDSKRVYKRANIWYMSELYKLLNCICSIVIEYDKNKTNKNIERISSECYKKFMSIYKDIKDCYSYFHLLRYLKSIYDGIRNDAIKEANTKKEAIKKIFIRSNTLKKAVSKVMTSKKNDSRGILEHVLNDLTISLKDLTPSDWYQRFVNDSNQAIDFHTPKCVELYSELAKPVKKDTPKGTSKDIPGAQTQLGSNQFEKEGNQSPSNKQPETSPQSSTHQPTHPVPSPPQPSTQHPIPPVPSPQIDPSSQKSQTGGSSSGNGNPDDGSNGSASNKSGGSFNFGTSSFELLLNCTKFYDKASNLIEQNKQRFKETKDKISNVYNDAVNNLKSVYDKSNNYLNIFISDVFDQLNKTDTPKQNGKHSGSGNPSGGGSTSNQLPPPQPPNTTNPSQPIIHPPPQADPPKNKTGDTKNLQLIKSQSTDPNLKKKWNIIPTTWNGSVECKSEVNFMNATLACCTSDHCSLTGVSVAVVLIPIFLLVAYKCLPREWTRKSEKKNMKRVINLADGNRKTKIIIKSYDRNKDLKSVINPVGRKKGPLLDIYKLMQADPIPFINLFFLLIFFVYKRKYDFLEL